MSRGSGAPMRQGLFAAAGAYFIWGLFPLYWKLLERVPSLQIMSHRIVWCALLVFAWLGAREGLGWLRTLPPKLFAMLCASSLLIACNWWLYIWAVNNGHIVATSLGYFINPLVSVLLGVFILGERLRPLQWLAVAVAGAGVLYLAVQAGQLPWISLALAFSFGGYGLVRKLAVIPAVHGLAVESGLLFLPALAVLLWDETHGSGSFGHINRPIDLLLIAAGAVTAIPLVMFAYGARRIPLSMIGVLQYLAPTLQLACGLLLYHEPFSHAQGIGFGCIWVALAIYATEGIVRLQRRSAAV
ncbi:MAG: EamA family transporter RarD [Stenotrophobium sp.]